MENFLSDIVRSHEACETIREKWIEFCKPTELKNYTPPENARLVGDYHIFHGSCFVIGGAPGIGKSRAGVALAIAGALGVPWFGLQVHCKFKTLIIQNENGRIRLQSELSELNCDELDEYVRICPPPPFGLAFEHPEFRALLKEQIELFKPDVVLIDPWNAAARDDKARDYLEAFNAIRSVLPVGDSAPALGIIAHTRKPKTDEKAQGRALINLLAGSYVLASVPRAVFVLQSASDDPSDDRIVFTCCKNNNGTLGSASAWQRKNGLFLPAQDFDWDEFNNGAQTDKKGITEEYLLKLFHNGTRFLSKKHAVKELMEISSCGQAACYAALALTGKFATNLREIDGLLRWIVPDST